MRLTLALLKRKQPPGNIWTGKHRLGHHAYALNIQGFVNRLKIEENNMLLLRYPYLTQDQEFEHGKALDKKEKRMDRLKLELAAKKVIKSTRFEDKLKHLCLAERWEDGAM